MTHWLPQEKGLGPIRYSWFRGHRLSRAQCPLFCGCALSCADFTLGYMVPCSLQSSVCGGGGHFTNNTVKVQNVLLIELI